ncbi:pseudouridine synthase [Comamonas sp. UBA7528]|uniref:pseudouridine synthase n=1 Tax=Comamonas sp. UBA7528 TaxID=1946391 RepID=UPI0025C13471|nr:pseudouridine synthase [Comamonas sp. UBA7528]
MTLDCARVAQGMDRMNPKDRAPRGAAKPAAGARKPRAAAPRAPQVVDAAEVNEAVDAADTALEAQGYAFEDVVSGALDADEAREDLAPAKRVLQPQAESPKLHKVLAQAGMGSRLEMEKLILEGRISVNNEPAHVGQRVQFGDQIKVNGKPIHFRIEPPPARVIAYHKPVGEVVTHDDPQNRPTVFRKLPKLHAGKWQSVGRLDLNTEGLLLLTNSGALANNLMHPRFGLEREYAVRVLGALSKEEKQRLLDGVQLEDGEASFGSIEDGGGEGANCWYRVTISEGRNREVRRMFEAVGHAVSRLIRIRYGAMMLPKGLKRGAWLELDDKDIQALMQAAGAAIPKAAPREGAGLRRPSADRGASRRSGPGAARPQAPRRFQDGGGPERDRPARSGALFGDEGAARSSAARAKRSAQPDPLKTSAGYIGRDSLERYRATQKKGSGGGRRGGSR